MNHTGVNQEALNDRARDLDAKGLNGIKLVLVSLAPALNPTAAKLEVHFHNPNSVQGSGGVLSDPRPFNVVFPISGGHRITAGSATGQIKVTAIAAGPTTSSLILTVEPIGDYSTYELALDYDSTKIDPLFSEIPFKFRPGCFNIDCAPEWEKGPQANDDPTIDYLAKDFDSFRHTMITAMMQRVPGWQPTSEADLDQVLIELFSASADELSDYQDRVMNEAYLATARKRVSLARHARLMDYHIHQGNQASTWLAVKVGHELDLPPDFLVGTGDDVSVSSSVVFAPHPEPLPIPPQHLHHLLDDIGLYTWADSLPTLLAGSTSADLRTEHGTQSDANDLVAALGNTELLLIQEDLNPLTGLKAGRCPNKRQILRLLSGLQALAVMRDPVTGDWFVRVHWHEEDQLKSDYCFTVWCNNVPIPNVSLFHGNLVQVFHGRPRTDVFIHPEIPLAAPNEVHYEVVNDPSLGEQATPQSPQVVVCRLPAGPLAHVDTAPGGEAAPVSTLRVEVMPSGGTAEEWHEVISLIHSSGVDKHFTVETDEEGRSLVRFGDGTNGMELPEESKVTCQYQVGEPLEGNIGADQLTAFDDGKYAEVTQCWNPFDVSNGRAPEPVEEIIRRVPEAYRFRQLRAVTLQDYVNRARELEDVSNAAATYQWTGSWRTVRVTIDPRGTTELGRELREKVEDQLDAVRLIGEDLEIRPPEFVPLQIDVKVCVLPDYWPDDISYILDQEFSDGFTPDGRMGFFHPDLWTFGQPLRDSQIIGRIQSVPGVDHVVWVKMKRYNEATPGTDAIIELQPNEIIQVKNDPDHMELGSIQFDVRGGLQ